MECCDKLKKKNSSFIFRYDSQEFFLHVSLHFASDGLAKDASVKDARLIVVLLDHRPTQIDTCKNAARTSVREYFRIHLPVGASLLPESPSVAGGILLFGCLGVLGANVARAARR